MFLKVITENTLMDVCVGWLLTMTGSTISEFVYSKRELHLEKFVHDVDTEEKQFTQL